jgi:hypothetical protein
MLSEPFFNNHILFSDYYLTERLPHSPEWNDPGETVAMTRALKQLRKLYADVRETFSNQPEAVVRTKLLEPVLTILGFTFQPIQASVGNIVQPDYKLYSTTGQAYDKPLALCLAYTWGRNLDSKDEQRDTQAPGENPGATVVTLLNQGEADWAFVTNGKSWRLHAAKAHSRATNYYEIDLEETLALPTADLEYAFHYFWLLFRAAAFISPEQETGAEQQMCFLDRLLSESEGYARELGERLKKRVFEEIFPNFAEGFIIHARNTGLIDTNLSSLDDEQHIHLLEPYFSGTLTFLYRLLFLLYAESRDLLPVRQVRGYYEKSLEKLKREIARQAGPIEDQAPANVKAAYNDLSTAFYDRLQELFQAADQGDTALNVPVYNGGLFATQPDPADTSPEADVARFLAIHKIPDRALALGLDLMARDIDEKRQDLVFIDYKSLGVRQLGSIYEGLLEFKLRIATEEMAVVKGKKTEEIVPYAEAQQKKLPILKEGRGKYDRTLPKGRVYLENDRRERKTMGSYYTPDYIVKYIVENTVSPVLNEKLEALRPAFREAEKTLHTERTRYAAIKKQDRVADTPENQAYLKHRAAVNEAFFDLKVLDPAMGSGHFLVEAVDYITDRMAAFLTAFKWTPVIHELARTRQEIQQEMQRQGVTIDMSKLTDINLLKRQVLKRCIYGVDLNPMAVELAKVSLWLDCFTLGAPLSFLDHHMKCGNSLIGGNVHEVLSQNLSGYQFAGLLYATEPMRHVGKRSDVTDQEVAESRNTYKSAYDALAPFKRLLDVWISEYFGNKGAKQTTRLYAGAIVANDYSEANEHDRKAIEAALVLATAKRFFHWELEFPEVFFDETKRKQNGGFDAVVGNPPYGIVFAIPEKRFLEATLSSFVRNNDLYVAFSEKCVNLLRAAGFASLIIPNTFVMGPYFNHLKEFWLTNTQVIFIDDFGYTVLFPDPHVFSAIFLCKKHGSGNTQETSLREASVQNNQVYYLGESGTLLSRLPLETWKLFNPVMQKAIKHGTPLKDLCLVKDVGFNYWTRGRGKTRGESIGSRILYDGPLEHPADIPFLKGGDFSRYEIPASRDHWLRHEYRALLDSEVDIFRFSPEFLKVPMKIVYRQTANNIVATLDPAGHLVDKTVHIVLLKAGNDGYSYDYLLAVLNSKLISHVYNNLAREEGRVFSQVKTFRVGQLPIHRIWFTTPPQARAYHLEKARKLYDYCMTKNNQACVTGFVEHHLSKEPEESDVVHDLLAFLAGEMIRLNKEKRATTKCFLDWLVATLKILPDRHEGIEVLTGKSKLLDYPGGYQKRESPLAFDELQHILLKNKARLGMSLSDSRLMDEISMHYEDSLGQVLPIKERLARTDALIDQVVYRLYGLTEQEIRVVEGRESFQNHLTIK